jgi:NodT family efflux transporter outer membrane factor (OMF) lipoprotein
MMNSNPSTTSHSAIGVSKTLIAIGVSAVLLSACANFKGIGSNAHTKVPGDYATANSLPGQGGLWPTESWAGKIGGAPLQTLVDEALANNPGLQIAAARVSAARAMAEGAGAEAKPIVAASLTDTYERFTEHGLVPPPYAGHYYSDGELALSFSYDFDFWGKHSADLRAAVSDEKAAQAEQYNARLMLATAITRSWVQLARQYDQLNLVEQQQEIRGKIDKLTQLRLRAGLDTQTEKQQTVLQTALLRNEQAQWQEAIALTRNQLAALVGKGPDRGISIVRPTLPSDEAIKLPDDLPLSLIGRRPDIVAARWRVEAAQGGIDAAKTQFYPNVNISAFVGSSALGLQYLLRNSSRIDGIEPAISMPIFEGGRLRAQLKGKVAGYDAAVATYNQALNDAFHDVADQVQSLRVNATQIENQHAATQAAAASLKLAQQREQVGTANMLQVLASESALLTQRKAELDSQARRADLSVALIKALGGGFDARSQDLDSRNHDSNKHEQAPASTPAAVNSSILPAEKTAS